MWPYFKINYEITFGHIYIHRPDSKVLVSRRQLVWFFSFSFGGVGEGGGPHPWHVEVAGPEGGPTPQGEPKRPE